jgi:hypothetical protein
LIIKISEKIRLAFSNGEMKVAKRECLTFVLSGFASD